MWRRVSQWIVSIFDLNDLFVFAGLAFACIGIWQIYPPAAWIGAGTALFWLGTR